MVWVKNVLEVLVLPK